MSDGIGEEFLEKTKYKYLSLSLQRQGIPQPPLEDPFDETRDRIVLPVVDQIPEFSSEAQSLRSVIESRRTVRRYQQADLAPEELIYLLWSTQGVKEIVAPKHTLRTVPSAGARHAFETYLLINQVDGIKPGLYRYLALENQLYPLNLDPEINQKITAACEDQQQVFTSAVTFIWVAIKARMVWRYGERGYRYLFLDAGHICQNLYLAAETVECGVCAIAAFDDDQLNSVLELDGVERFAVYLGSLGKKRV